MFLLMGYICYHGVLTDGLFRAARNWLGGLPRGLGIATLLLMVPIWLAALHQAGALIVLTLLLWLAFEVREPSPAGTAAHARA